MTERIAIVVLTRDGLTLARRLRPVLGGAQIHGLAQRIGTAADVSFENVGDHLRFLFQTGDSIVAVCAAGIVVRALGAAVKDKRNEPPVVVLSADGASIVPLLGGHRGANKLARQLAKILDGHAAITTAGDLADYALDDPPPGWSVANPAAAKPVSAAILAGEPVGLIADAGDTAWLAERAGPHTSGLRIRATDREVPVVDGELLLHPPTLAVGIGCERGAAAEEIVALVDRSLADSGLARASVACVASIDLKADEPAVHAAAAALGVPARFFDAATLERERARLANPSDAVFAEVGCHGVAEGAALAAAGANGTLHLPKQKSARGTCAIARRDTGIDPARAGRPAGQLYVVGLGPGGAEYRLPAADRALRLATDIVGYSGYVELLEPIGGNKQTHRFALGEEEARCRHALQLAAQGRTVALVCSGDPGIYAMAALVMELTEREGHRVLIDVVPGVSALQLAAARCGALLGHDFCAVSLSDLLTPWHAIERRLEAAGQGDFVVALYNPASRQRRTQLARACDILLRHRRPDTPVVVGRQLARPGESIDVMPLADLSAARVDMLSIVIVGSSETRMFDTGARRWIYTPRGYATGVASAA